MVALLILALVILAPRGREIVASDIAEPVVCSAAPAACRTSANSGDREQVDAYLGAVHAQRAAVASAADIAERFLTTNPNSLDQRERTRFLAALRTLRENANAAAALTPPPGWEAVHRRHVESLAILASAGGFYTTGMDTHDPAQYDRAIAALADGRIRFDRLGAELHQLAPAP